MSVQDLIDAGNLVPPDEPYDWAQTARQLEIAVLEDFRQLLPEESRLIAWANTGNGETVFWRVDPGASPDAFPVYIEDADGGNWERFDLTATAFLEGIVTGDVDPESFSETFVRVDQVYRPYPSA